MSYEYQVPGLTRIALGCTYLQAGRVNLHFPGSSTSSPSLKVVLRRNVNPPLGTSDNRWFPFWVPWDYWQYTVVPLLLGEGKALYEQTLKQPQPDWDLLTRAWLGLLIRARDPSLQEVSTLEALAQIITSPVIRAPVAFIGDLDYPSVDTELTWPEGHPKLKYPEVT